MMGTAALVVARKNSGMAGIKGTGEVVLRELEGFDALFSEVSKQFFPGSDRVSVEVLVADIVPWHDDTSISFHYTDKTVVTPLSHGDYYLHVLAPGRLIKTVKMEVGVPLEFNRTHRHRVTSTPDPNEHGMLQDDLVLLAVDNRVNL